jgi:hypothetical protein
LRVQVVLTLAPARHLPQTRTRPQRVRIHGDAANVTTKPCSGSMTEGGPSVVNQRGAQQASGRDRHLGYPRSIEHQWARVAAEAKLGTSQPRLKLDVTEGGEDLVAVSFGLQHSLEG